MSRQVIHLSKLINLLETFSVQEWKDFGLYVFSDFFKTSSNTQRLFDYLKPLHPKFEEAKINEHRITQKQPLLKSKITQAKAGSELLQAAEDFLSISIFESSDFERICNLLQAYHNKGLYALFEKKLFSLLEEEEKKGIEDYYSFERRYRLCSLWFHSFPARLIRNQTNDISKQAILRQQNFALHQLKTYCSMIARQQILGIPFEAPLLDWVLQTLAPFDSPNNLYVFVHIRLFHLHDTDFEKAFPIYQELKKCWVSFEDKNNLPDALIEMLVFMSTFCQYWYNKGKYDLGHEYLWWTDQKIAHNRLLENGHLDPTIFTNYITLGVICKLDKKQLSNFYNTYSNFLRADLPSSNRSFCKALYHYVNSEMELAIVAFNDALMKEDLILNAIVRRWEFMLFFEYYGKKEASMLADKLNAFEKYILRNKKEFHVLKTPFNTFIKYARKLLNTPKSEMNALKQGIEREVHFPGKDWMIGIVEKAV